MTEFRALELVISGNPVGRSDYDESKNGRDACTR
jgi:hypothetical protein